MELFTYPKSSAAYRVRIALNIKGIRHTLTPVNLLESEQTSEAYKALNPQGLVPALKLDNGQILTQSPAILEYLEDISPQIPLLPQKPADAAVVRSWCNVIGCDIHPIDNLRVLKYLTGPLQHSEDAKLIWYHHWIKLGFDVLEHQFKAAPYCFGDQVTHADLYLVPQVYNALRFNHDMSAYPKIMRIYTACHQLPAFINASPDNQ